LKEPFQTQLLASWEDFFQNQFDDIFPNQDEIISTPLLSQLTLHHEPIKKKLKPATVDPIFDLWNFIGSTDKIVLI
jgi:hypothetical protein